MINRPILLSREIATDRYELTLIEPTNFTPEKTDPYYFVDFKGKGRLEISGDRATVDKTALESIAKNFGIPFNEIIEL